MASTVIVRHTGGYCEMRLTTDVKSEPPYGTVYTLEFFFMDPGANLLATITNQSPNAVQGQVVAFGFGPVTSVVTPLPTGPPAGQPFFLNDAARRT